MSSSLLQPGELADGQRSSTAGGGASLAVEVVVGAMVVGIGVEVGMEMGMGMGMGVERVGVERE